ncbi:MAG: ATP-binding protein [Candidatus Latescibacterota bacterium]
MNSPKDGDRFALPLEQGLRARLAWFIKLRWVAATGVVAATWAAQQIFRLDVPERALYGIGLTIFFYNALFALFYAREVAKVPLSGSTERFNRFAHLQVAVDWLALICSVHYSGGIESPIILYFIFHIILDAILLSRWTCYLYTTFAASLLILVTVLEYHRILPHIAIRGFSSQTMPFDALSLFGSLFFFVSMFYISAFLATSVTVRLRKRELELAVSKRSLEEAYGDLKELDKAKTEQLIQTRKLAFIGHFASGVAHEINNPLGGILNCTRMLLSSPAIQGEKRQYLELTLKGLIRIEDIVRRLLIFSHQRRFEPQLTDIEAVLEEALAFTEYRAREQGVEVEKAYSLSLPTLIADPSQLQQVFMNIVKNSFDAMSGGGKLRIQTEKKDGHVLIAFTDTGGGIRKEDVGRIFDPFFTTKEVGEGLGLGLSVSYGIIQQHDGTIRAESIEGHGTTVTILLPIRRDFSDRGEDREEDIVG